MNMANTEKTAKPQVMVIPVLKLRERLTYDAALGNSAYIVVKMQELLSSDGTKFNRLFAIIQSAGGLHNYLSYKGEILLSFVMPNKMIRGCRPENYAQAIQALKPNYATTIDGETYTERVITSKKECERCIDETVELMKLCPGQRFYGLVKGSSVAQIEDYTNRLLSLGIDTFILHVGDFLCRGSKREIFSAVVYADQIRKKVPSLILYGLSSPSYILKFPRSEAYVTQTHYISAFKRLTRCNGKWKKTGLPVTSQMIEHNFLEIVKEANELFAPNGGLSLWAEEVTKEAAPMQEVDMALLPIKNMDTQN